MIVTIPNTDASAAMELVRDLRSKGLVQGKDFDFKYHPAKYDDTGFDMLSTKSVEFSFKDDKWATFFRMKYDGAY